MFPRSLKMKGRRKEKAEEDLYLEGDEEIVYEDSEEDEPTTASLRYLIQESNGGDLRRRGEEEDGYDGLLDRGEEIVSSFLEDSGMERTTLDRDDDEGLEKDTIKGAKGSKMIQREPRQYQLELFHKALEKNVIAYLDTGSGKTFIAVMLIKEMAQRTPQGGGKWSFLLVNSVVLVFQHQEHIKNASSLSVAAICGERSDRWTSETWENEFKAHRVFVMTAQIYLDLLRHGFTKIEDADLIVFDECHHATGDHPYVCILREFYRPLNPDQRPKILGLTASPLKTKSAVDTKALPQKLAELQRNLDAVIYTTSYEDELQRVVSRPQEKEVKYEGVSYQHPSFAEIIAPYNKLSYFDWIKDTKIKKSLRKLINDVGNMLLQLGVWCARRYIDSFRRKLTEYIYLTSETSSSSSSSEAEVEKKPFKFRYDSPKYWQKQDPIVMEKTLGIMEKMLHDIDSRYPQIRKMTKDNPELWREKDQLQRDYTNTKHQREIQRKQRRKEQGKIVEESSTSGDSEPLYWTPKVCKLLDELKKVKPGKFRGIIFVERRSTAKMLASFLDHHPGVPFRADYLVGSQSDRATGGDSAERNFQKQGEVLKGFRRNEISLLVATSVAEEGLDVPACNYVVRFDPLQSFRAYVQSRGRARHKKSRYLVFIPRSEGGDNNLWQQSQQLEKRIKEHCRTVTIWEPEDNNEPDPFDEQETFTTKTGTAKMSLCFSLSLLNRYCATLSRDEFLEDFMPSVEYEGEGVGPFTCKLLLPSNCPLPPNQRVFYGTGITKKNAKRRAAFQACRLLYASGCLDERLLPTTDSLREENKKALREFKEAKATFTAKVPAILQYFPPSSSQVRLRFYYIEWSVPIETEEDPSFGGFLLAFPSPEFESIPGFQFRVPIGVRDNEVRLTFRGYLDLEQERVDEAVRFQSKLLETAIQFTSETSVFVGKWEKTRKNYLLLPLKKGKGTDSSQLEVDWEMIRNHPPSNTVPSSNYESPDLQLLVGRIVAVEVAGCKRLRRVVEISKEANGHTPVGKRMPRSFFERHQIKRPQLPLLILKSVRAPHKSRGYPWPFDLCSIYPLPSSLIEVARHLPLVMSLLEDHLLARELASKLPNPFLNIIDKPDLENAKSGFHKHLAEALTTKERGRTFSQERLEVLGDTVLKYLSTLEVMSKYPYANENELSERRKQLITNCNLYSKAMEKDITSYVAVEKFDPRNWEPPGQVPTSRAHLLKSQSFVRSGKKVADTVEAIIAAYYLSANEDGALSFLKWMGLPFESPKETINWTPPGVKAQYDPQMKVFEDTKGYTFKDKALLMTAFTHPSFKRGDYCYEKLEFLGDAVLDLILVNDLFTGCEISPGEMSAHLHVCNSNWAYAYTAAKHGFSKFVRHESPYLYKSMARLYGSVDLRLDDLLMKVDEPPKALSDVFEAVAGAIFIDSGFDIGEVWKVYNEMLSEFSETYAPAEGATCRNLNPVHHLLELCQKHACRLGGCLKRVPSSDGRIKVVFYLHDREIAYGEGTTRRVARHRAAVRALQTLEQNLHYFREVCDCASRINDLRPTQY